MTDGVRIELHAYRMLHPGVGYKNPYGGDGGADTCHPGGQQMGFLVYFFPSEEHHSKEGGFHEEGQDAFDGQRCAEDVAHEPGIVAPVGAEFEFQDDTRSNAHGKIDSEKFHPELGSPFPELVFLEYIKGFHGCHDNGQP